MTEPTVDEAREALLAEVHTRAGHDAMLAFEAAIRAEYDFEPEDLAAANLAAGDEARRANEAEKQLAALQEAAQAVVKADTRAQSDDDAEAEEGEYAMSDALDALRVALAATHEEDER